MLITLGPATVVTISALTGVVGFLFGLVAHPRKPKVNLSDYADPMAGYKELKQKLRKPWTHRAKSLIRW